MKKGFTLVELLAVIVILAIISLIAVPVVLNIIEDSKKNTTLNSAEFYLDAVELSIVKSIQKGQKIETGFYNIMSDGNICLEEYKFENEAYVCLDNDENDENNILVVEIKGDVPTSGVIAIEKGNIVKELNKDGTTTKTELNIGDYTIGYNTSTKKLEVTNG